VAVPDVVEAAADADILIFVLPHQFIVRALTPLKGKLKSSAIGISLIKVKPDKSSNSTAHFMYYSIV